MLSGEDAEGMDFSSTSPVAEDWDSIILHLGKKYPYWMNLYPLECHPLFRKRVWKLLSDSGSITKNRSTRRWMDILKMKGDIGKAKRLFKEAGFDLPAIPDKLTARIKQRSELDFSTRAIPMSPNHLNFYVDEANKTQMRDYVILSRAVNSPTRSAIHYFIVFGPLRMFLQLFWGGNAYIKSDQIVAQVAQIRECFALADQIVTASISECKASDRLTIVCTNDGGSYWVAPGQGLQGEKWYLKRPEEVLGEALQWLRNESSKFEDRT